MRMLKLTNTVAPPSVIVVLTLHRSSPHSSDVVVLRQWMVVVGSWAAAGVGGVGCILGTVDVCVAVAVARVLIVMVGGAPATTQHATVAAPVSLCAGLRLGEAGVRGQQSLHAGEAGISVPEISCRWEMIDGSESELLLAVAPIHAMFLPFFIPVQPIYWVGQG